MAASVKLSSTPSVAISACCCRIMLCSGSVRIRKKSFALHHGKRVSLGNHHSKLAAAPNTRRRGMLKRREQVART